MTKSSSILHRRSRICAEERSNLFLCDDTCERTVLALTDVSGYTTYLLVSGALQLVQGFLVESEALITAVHIMFYQITPICDNTHKNKNQAYVIIKMRK